MDCRRSARSRSRAEPCPAARPFARSTLDFAGIGDHVRMPARFFGRLTASDAAGLARG